jgi:hypothetical protein
MKSSKRIVFIIGVFTCLFLLVQLVYNYNRTERIPQNEIAFLLTLSTSTEFQKFSGAPLDNAYPGISSVKVVYDLHRKQIYFVNSNLYKLHYDFCNKVLGYKLGLDLFNIANYGSKREYYLANINYVKSSNQYVLEFGSFDEIDSLQIIDMYKHVSTSAFMKGDLQLLLNNTNTVRYFTNQNKLPTCDLSALNEGLTYHMIQAGSCVVRLMI